MSTFYQLSVLSIESLTKEASCVSLDVPPHLYNTFDFKPGQYLTLKFTINGEEVRRSYSLSSRPSIEEPLRVGVKRVKGGLVSNYINDELKIGDLIDVMPPGGEFYAEVDPTNYKTYFLFAAGSGITPILSILRTVLISEPQSFVHMIYGNTNQDGIMFKKELDELEAQYPDRLFLVHSLSRPKSQWSDLWTSANEAAFRKGRVDAEAVNWFISNYPPYAQNVVYFICGPGSMIENTRQSLLNIDVPKERIFVESFGGKKIEDPTVGIVDAKLSAYLNGELVQTTIAGGTTVLRALIQEGKEPPYSCEGGVCSTCKCKLTEGKVHMRNNLALDEKDMAEGYILSCQSIPLTDEIVVKF